MQNVIEENKKLEILNEIHPAFSNFDLENKPTQNKNSKIILKIMTSMLLTFLYSNIYMMQKSKSL